MAAADSVDGARSVGAPQHPPQGPLRSVSRKPDFTGVTLSCASSVVCLPQTFTAPSRQVGTRRAARLVGRVPEGTSAPEARVHACPMRTNRVRVLAGTLGIVHDDIPGGRKASPRRSAETVQGQSAQHAPARHARSPRVGMRLHPHKPRVSVQVRRITARVEPSPCLLPTAVSPMRPQVEVGGGGGRLDAPAPGGRAAQARSQDGEQVRRRRQHQVCAGRRVRAFPFLCCVLTACVRITGLRNDGVVDRGWPWRFHQLYSLVSGAGGAGAARHGLGERGGRCSGSWRGCPPGVAAWQPCEPWEARRGP